MSSFFFILLPAVTQALAVNGIRNIQANASSIYRAITVGYITSATCGLIAVILTHADKEWLIAIPYGAFTGFFYILSLVAMIRSMGQRGLAITIAIANTSMVMAVLMAIVFGDRPSTVQSIGIALAVIAIPILSLCTASGKAINEAPSIKMAIFLFFVRGLAAVGNLIAEEKLPKTALLAYVTALFGSAFVFGIIAIILFDKKNDLHNEPNIIKARFTPQKADIRTGFWFGIFNVSATSSLLFALTKVDESIVFAAYSVMGISITVLFALWLWRERVQCWGWLGFILALIAVILMRM